MQYLLRALFPVFFLLAPAWLHADFVDDACTEGSSDCVADVITADDPYLLIRGKGRLRFLRAPADKPVLGAFLTVAGFSVKPTDGCDLEGEDGESVVTAGEMDTFREHEATWALGFHIYALTWCDRSTFIQRNSFVLEKALGMIRDGDLGSPGAPLVNNQKLAVMGGSMGGLVARHALSRMESQGKPHGAELFISFDSPQLGGYLPPSIQKANAVMLAPVDLVSVILLRFPLARVLARLSNDDRVAELVGMDSPAARQMLMVHHSSFRSSGPHPDFVDLFDELDGYGWPGRFGMRTVGIANGMSGRTDRRLEGVTVETKRATITNKFVGVEYKSPINGETLWKAGLDVKYRVPLRMTLSPLTQGDANQEILRIDFDNAELQVNDLKILPARVPASGEIKEELGFPDWIPTGIVTNLLEDAFDAVADIVNDALDESRGAGVVFRSDAPYGYEAGGAGLGDKYTAFHDALGGLSVLEVDGGGFPETFIPTRSALHTPGDPLEPITEEDVAASPFDQLYHHKSDTNHVAFTGRVNRWICREMNDLILRTFVSSVSPSRRPVSGKEFTLTVRGGNFNNSSVVMWNNDGVLTELATTYVDGGTLTAFVPANLIGTLTRCTDDDGCPTPTLAVYPGERLPVRVSVVTPKPLLASTTPDWAPDTAPGCAQRANFGIEEVPLPAFDPAEPTSVDEISATYSDDWTNGCIPMDPVVAIDGGEIRVTTTGDGPICTTVIAPYTLEFSFGPLPAGDYTMVIEDQRAGLDGATVTSPIATRLFSVENPVPAIHNVTPADTPAGSPATMIQVIGEGFVEDDSLVFWNGAALETVHSSATALNAVIPANLLRFEGMADITVETADPNETLVSEPFPFVITQAELRLDSIEPEIVPINSPATAVTLTGVSFDETATVAFTRGDGTTGSLAPTLAGSTRIVVALPASELRAAQRLLFSVSKGELSSDALPFEVFSEEEPEPSGPIANAVVNAASFAGPIAPGSLATLFGSGLAVAQLQVGEFPLPTDLLGTQILIGGIAAPQLYLSPGQVNFQAPFELSTGDVTLQVIRGGEAGPETTIRVVPNAFGVFQYDRDGSGLEPIVTHANASLVTPDSPAAPGETVVVYGTGVGEFTNPPVTGGPAGADPLAVCAQSPRPFVLGGQLSEEGSTAFCGLTPGFASLVQINVTLPARLPPGSSYRLGLLFPGGELQSWTLWISE